jgi:hypothetical protein
MPQGQAASFVVGKNINHQTKSAARQIRNLAEDGAWALEININREDPPKVGGCHGRGRHWGSLSGLAGLPDGIRTLSVRQMHNVRSFLRSL